MSLETFFYNDLLGEQSPAQKQATWNEVYDNVIKAGGTADDATSAANQAIRAENVSFSQLSITPGNAVYAVTGTQASVIGSDIKSGIQSAAGFIGETISKIISDKLLIVLVVVLGILIWWKK